MARQIVVPWVGTCPRPSECRGPRPKAAKPHTPRENSDILQFRERQIPRHPLGQLTFRGLLPGRCKLMGQIDLWVKEVVR